MVYICENKKIEKSLLKNLNKVTNYLTSIIKKAFLKLYQMFIKTSIFQYFDLKRYTQIETNILSYAIDEILSHLILNNLG